MAKERNFFMNIERKVHLCEAIYDLIRGIIKDNPENAAHAFKLAHHYQHHVQLGEY
jgi:F0F1-type ATP synthase membrane subunit a